MLNTPFIPPYIALCGNPKSGKSLVQELLQSELAVQPVDDGWPLREFAINNLGLTFEQVTTQAGKMEFVEILGRRWQVREILGELGNRFETMFGKDIMPFMAMARCERAQRHDPEVQHFYSFGSVRRDQGRCYQERGGIVIGIRNPLAGPSFYEFDRFDETVVDAWIENDAQRRGLNDTDGRLDLRDKVLVAVQEASRKRGLLQ